MSYKLQIEVNGCIKTAFGSDQHQPSEGSPSAVIVSLHQILEITIDYHYPHCWYFLKIMILTKMRTKMTIRILYRNLLCVILMMKPSL